MALGFRNICHVLRFRIFMYIQNGNSVKQTPNIFSNDSEQSLKKNVVYIFLYVTALLVHKTMRVMPHLCVSACSTENLCVRSGSGARSEGWGDAGGSPRSHFFNCSVQLVAGAVWIPGGASHATAHSCLFPKSGLGQRQLDFWSAERSVNAGERRPKANVMLQT